MGIEKNVIYGYKKTHGYQKIIYIGIRKSIRMCIRKKYTYNMVIRMYIYFKIFKSIPRLEIRLKPVHKYILNKSIIFLISLGQDIDKC